MRKAIIFLVAILLVQTAMAINVATVTDFGDGKIIKDCAAINSGESVYNVYKNLDANRNDLNVDFDGDKIPPYNPFIRGINGYNGRSISLTKFEGWNFWVTNNAKNDFKEPPELAPGWGMGIGDYKITNSGEVIGLRYGVTEYNADFTIKTPPEKPRFALYEDICERLIIKEVNAYINGDKKKLYAGENVKVSPESRLKLRIDAKNLYEESIAIKDIQITATIKGIDDGDDIKEETSNFNLDAEESQTETIELEIPLEVDDKAYDLELKIEGKDSRGIEYAKTLEYSVDVEKEKHDIIIRKAELTNPVLKCSRTTLLDLNFVNIGTEEENVVLNIINNDLGINKQSSFKLGKDPFDEESRHTASFTIQIDSGIKAGTYTILVKANYNTKTAEKTAELKVEDCEANKIETKTEQPISSSQQSQKTAEKTPITASAVSKTSGNNYILIPLLLGILIIIIFGGLLVAWLFK